jgi:hypothetical protein
MRRKRGAGRDPRGRDDGPGLRWLPGVDQDQLAVFERGDRDPVEAGDRRAIAGIDLDLATRTLPLAGTR